MGTRRILDLYCKAGGASMGYFMALAADGFEIEGLDLEPQPNYPFRFFQGDALAIDPRKVRRRYHAVVASPPCLGYTTLANLHQHIKHDRLIPATRDVLEEIDLPYVIENVENAKAELIDPVQLCGSSFGLRVRRHRLFEANFELTAPACNHAWQSKHRPYRLTGAAARGRYPYSGIVPVHGGGQLVGGNDLWYGSVAMGIDWMTRAELNQAVPPAFTYYLGRQLKRAIG